MIGRLSHSRVVARREQGRDGHSQQPLDVDASRGVRTRVSRSMTRRWNPRRSGLLTVSVSRSFPVGKTNRVGHDSPQSRMYQKVLERHGNRGIARRHQVAKVAVDRSRDERFSCPEVRRPLSASARILLLLPLLRRQEAAPAADDAVSGESQKFFARSPVNRSVRRSGTTDICHSISAMPMQVSHETLPEIARVHEWRHDAEVAS